MKIYYDILPALDNHSSGTKRYCENLFWELKNLELINNFKIIACANRSRTSGLDNYGAVRIRYPYRNLRRRISMNNLLYDVPLEWWLGDFDIYHGTFHSILPTKKAKKIITMHDVVEVSAPDTVSKKDAEQAKKNNLFFMNNADHIITVSQATKLDIIKYYNMNPDKISVVHLAADEKYQKKKISLEVAEKIRTKYALPKQFLLHVGMLRKRKNIPNTIRGFALVKNDIPHDLVFVGAWADAKQEIEDTIRELGIKDRVHFLGGISEEDLLSIYNMAEVFLQVSYLEGFGLPIIEALKCGLPVVASNNSAIPEVLGDGGIMVEASDYIQIAEGIRKILSSQEIYRTYTSKGLAHAENFSWRKTAEATFEVYRKVSEG